MVSSPPPTSVAPSVDLVLFSHGDLAHLGLYAYAHARWGLNAPVYSSLPVQALGRIAATEEAENIRASQDVDHTTAPSDPSEEEDPQDLSEASEPAKRAGLPHIATPAEITAAFETIVTLRYSQPTHLSGKCQGLTITAYGAGHTLGGTIWKIRSASSGTILYAVNLNHMKERHLDGTALIKSGGNAGGGGSVVFEPLARPDLLITDAERTLMIVPRRKDRDAVLLETITSTLEDARKSVLIPCDTSARLLELLLMLDQHWQFARLRAPICLVSRTGKEMINLVRSLVEWMGGSTGLEDDETGTATLKLRHLEFFASPSALMQAYPSFPTPANPNPPPKLILAVPASLSHGPSRELFAEFAKVPGNLVLLTARGEAGSLSRSLFDRWVASTGLNPEAGGPPNVGAPVELAGVTLSLTIRSKVPLEGDELEEHLARERAAKEREAAAQGALARSQRLLEADEGGDDNSSDSSDDEDAREAGDGLNAMNIDDGGAGGRMDWSLLDNAEDTQANAQQVSFDIFLKGNTVSRTATSFFRSGAADTAPNEDAETEIAATDSTATPGEGLTRYRMFPMVERRRRVDAYGEVLDVGAWLRKGKALEEETKAGKDTGAAGLDPEDVDINTPAADLPSKFITTAVDVPLQCQAFYVDMEGLNDGRAIKTIVPQVNPRKMIVVHASSDATTALIGSCGSIRTMTKEIFSPNVHEPLVIGQQTNTYSILLSDEVLEQVAMSRFEDNQVGHIQGRVSVGTDSTIPTLEPLSVITSSKTLPATSTQLSAPSLSSHVQKALASRSPSALPRSTVIGDLKLTILKSRLAALGVSAEFAGEGVLVCNGNSTSSQVAVKKTGRGQVVLEGPPSQVYYLVRQEVYGLHAVVVS